jgi:hypothetical protein
MNSLKILAINYGPLSEIIRRLAFFGRRRGGRSCPRRWPRSGRGTGRAERRSGKPREGRKRVAWGVSPRSIVRSPTFAPGAPDGRQNPKRPQGFCRPSGALGKGEIVTSGRPGAHAPGTILPPHSGLKRLPGQPLSSASLKLLNRSRRSQVHIGRLLVGMIGCIVPGRRQFEIRLRHEEIPMAYRVPSITGVRRR